MQPAFMQAARQSQQAWHMAQQSSSPLVQVKHTPSLVSAHSHLHIEKQQLHTMIPFIRQQQLHMLPAIILHRFCKVAAATSSSQVQVILNPPLHFSSFIVQRGTMHICVAPGMAAGMPALGICVPIDPSGLIMLLSIIIMLAIRPNSFLRPKLAWLADRWQKKSQQSPNPFGRPRPAAGDPVSKAVTVTLTKASRGSGQHR
jgi:hypothetical protein